MGARMASQGPTAGGGGSFRLRVQRSTRDNCKVLMTTSINRPPQNKARPMNGPSHQPIRLPNRAQITIDVNMLNMGSGAWSLFQWGKGKTIARATNRFNMFVVSARLQRLAQATNMDVYRAFFHKDVITPDLIQQLGAGKYALGVCHEEMQQAELGRPNGQRHALAGQAVRAGVQLKVAN